MSSKEPHHTHTHQRDGVSNGIRHSTKKKDVWLGLVMNEVNRGKSTPLALPLVFRVPALPPLSPSLPLSLHRASGHVLFIGISPQSAVLIVHLCWNRGVVCNMALVIICARAVLKKENPICDASTRNCCCGLFAKSLNKQEDLLVLLDTTQEATYD